MFPADEWFYGPLAILPTLLSVLSIAMFFGGLMIGLDASDGYARAHAGTAIYAASPMVFLAAAWIFVAGNPNEFTIWLAVASTVGLALMGISQLWNGEGTVGMTIFGSSLIFWVLACLGVGS